MAFSRMNAIADHQMKLIISVLFLLLNVQVYSYNVSLTVVPDAVAKGAVCLDGTPPAYNFLPGVGDGAQNWMIVLEGGAWCYSEKECTFRVQKTALGGSNNMPRVQDFQGILSPSKDINPYFYDWNKVYVKYCDGASFTADVEEVNTTTNFHFRGARIYNYMMEEFKKKGMESAKNAILMGGSAGALGAMLKCDDFRAQLPNVPRVKCISESGFFYHTNQTLVPSYTANYFGGIVKFHQTATLLPKSCTSKMDPQLCMFPENFIGDMKTPLFIIQSQFDQVQLKDMIFPPANTTQEEWFTCRNSIKPCNEKSSALIRDYKNGFLQVLPKRDGSFFRGYYIDSCYTHDHSLNDFLWSGRPTVKNTTVSQAVGEWYYDIRPFQEIEDVDHQYKCHL